MTGPAATPWPARAAARLDAVIGPVCTWLARVGAACLGAMGLLTVVDILGRFFLNRPVPGALELSEFALAVLVFFALGATGLAGNQVVVDIATEHFPPRLRAASDGLAALLGVVFWVLVAWRTTLQARTVFAKGEVSTILGVPAFPFVLAAALGAGVMALALVGRFLLALPRLAGR